MKTQSKPWHNPDGTPKSLDELKKISKDWSIRQWEDYALSLEVPQRETLLEGSEIEQYSNEQNAFDDREGCGDEHNLQLKKIMLEEVSKLPTKQRYLIDLLFKQGMSLSQVARELGVCRSTVMRNRNRLLEKLRVKILTQTHTLDVEAFLREIAA